MYIDALLADGADGSALVADLYFFALALKAALTLSSWSTSPCTLPRGAGCLGQGLCLRWPVSCVPTPMSHFAPVKAFSRARDLRDAV